MAGIGVLLGTAVAFDLARSLSQSARNAPPPAPPIQQAYPPTDPKRSIVRLAGDRRTRWLKRKPTSNGDAAPALEFQGDGEKSFRLPAPDGKPTVLLLTSGTEEATPLVAPIRNFVALYGEQAQVGMVVLNSEQASWEQHTGNLGKTAIVLYWDKTGDVLEKLRPKAADPEALPVVWGFDGKGKVRYFDQLAGAKDTWRDDLRAALGIPKAEQDLATGSGNRDAPGLAHP